MKTSPTLSILCFTTTCLAALAFCVMAWPVQGATVIDPTGAGYTQASASSAFNTDYGPDGLFNADLSGVPPGSTLTDAKEWATAAQMTAYVAFQLPAAHTVTSLFFAQRDSGGRPDTDQMNLASIWASETAAFDPNQPPARAADAFLVLTNDSGNPVWTEYSLANSIAGRYFLVQFVKTNGTCCNPGGRELRLGEAASASGVAAQVLAAGPMAYWQLNESPGATMAVDAMGAFDAAYGLTSILGNPGPRAPTFPGFPAENTALETTLADPDSVVTVPPLNLNTNTMTIIAWINPAAEQDPYATLLAWRDAGGAGYGLLAYGGQLGWIWNNWGWWETTGLTIPTSQWSMAAVVVTPTEGTIYLGASGGLTAYVSRNANTNAAFDTPITLGGEPGGTRVFNGLIDDVAIYSHALSADQIQAIYATGVGQLPVSITQQPVSRTNYAGGTARFEILATGSNAKFQWKKGSAALADGGNISGAKTPTLVIANASSADAGSYSCTVSNLLGSLSSDPASLEVIAVPTNGYDAAVLRSRPLAYWQMNEPPGAAKTIDYWGGFDGTPLAHAALGINGPQPPDLPGFSTTNTGLQTTVGDGATSVAVPALNLNDNHATLLMWIYPMGSQSAFTSMFANRSGGYDALNYNGDAATLSYQWNSWGWDSGILIPSDQWSLVGLVITPTDTTVYLGTGGMLTNNSQVIDNPVLSFAGTSYIGCDSGNDTRVFNGIIDDVAFYNRSLSTAEVSLLYGAALGQAPPPPPTLVWSVTSDGLVLTWSPPWTLMEANSITGTWSPATTVVSGVLIPMTAASRFYQLR